MTIALMKLILIIDYLSDAYCGVGIYCRLLSAGETQVMKVKGVYTEIHTLSYEKFLVNLGC